MQYVGRALPPSYVFEGLRGLLKGSAVSGAPLLMGVLLAIFYVLLAGWTFTRVYRHAVRTGLIARYSAETIS
jgi:ABC-2 type transport system permease protein